MALDQIDPEQDRDRLVWAHGYFSAVLRTIERKTPEFITAKTLLESVQRSLEQLNRSPRESGKNSQRTILTLWRDPSRTRMDQKARQFRPPGRPARSSVAEAPHYRFRNPICLYRLRCFIVRPVAAFVSESMWESAQQVRSIPPAHKIACRRKARVCKHSEYTPFHLVICKSLCYL